MKQKAIVFSLILLILAFARTAGAGLDDDVRAVLQNRLLKRASVGIVLAKLGQSPDQAKIVYEFESHRPLMPASNMKVVTTSTSLDLLGDDFSFQTMLARRGDDLIIIGDGDPTFGDGPLLRRSGWDVDTVFKNWADMLKKRGVERVGDVLVDDSVFDEVFFHPSWSDRDQQVPYMAEVGGLNLNINCIDITVRPTQPEALASYVTNPITRYATILSECRTGQGRLGATRRPGTNEIILTGGCPTRGEVSSSLTIHDPPMYAATVLADTLSAAGIKVAGKVARDRTARAAMAARPKDSGIEALAIHKTALTTSIVRANKDSVNMCAESICKRNGFAASGQSGSWENGSAAAGAFLKKLGIAEEEYHFDDGSGLSRQNAISTSAMVRVLTHNYHAKYWPAFRDSLAVGGRDGTLKDRFENGLRDRVMAKTGYINQVSALSGYLRKGDNWYAFSILMNDLPGDSNASIKPLIDQIVKAMDENVK